MKMKRLPQFFAVPWIQIENRHKHVLEEYLNVIVRRDVNEFKNTRAILVYHNQTIRKIQKFAGKIHDIVSSTFSSEMTDLNQT